jgi:hypothetical protein
MEMICSEWKTICFKLDKYPFSSRDGFPRICMAAAGQMRSDTEFLPWNLYLSLPSDHKTDVIRRDTTRIDFRCKCELRSHAPMRTGNSCTRGSTI